MEVRPLRQMFDLGQLALLPFSPQNNQSILNSVKRSNIVINLIGKEHSTHHITGTINYSLEDTLVNIPRKIAKISREAGVQAFIHVSALSANTNSESEWSRLKAKGEVAVREEFPDAIIVRPAIMYGHEDKYLNRVAHALEHLPFVPMIRSGVNQVQPVNVNDVATAIDFIVNGCHEFKGQTFELAGPQVYSHREIVELVADITVRPAFMLNIPDIFWDSLATIPANPFVHASAIAKLKEDNILIDDGSALTFSDLGMTPSSLENEAFDFLHHYRPGGHFRTTEGYYSTEQERLVRDLQK